MRKGFEGLFGLVRSAMRQEPLSGHVFGFCNRSRNRIKLLYFDGTGLWICAKRIERGCFKWPAMAEGSNTVTLNRAELAMLLEGFELKAMHPRKWYRRAVEGEEKEEGKNSEEKMGILESNACQAE